jgi:hypothetical protein
VGGGGRGCCHYSITISVKYYKIYWLEYIHIWVL